MSNDDDDDEENDHLERILEEFQRLAVNLNKKLDQIIGALV